MSKIGIDRYGFGFNGQEKVNEIAGIGNHNTAQYWEYDTRLARRWNLDPMPKIEMSNYAVLSNNPITQIDPLGNTDNKANKANPNNPKAKHGEEKFHQESRKLKDKSQDRPQVVINKQYGGSIDQIFQEGTDNNGTLLLNKEGNVRVNGNLKAGNVSLAVKTMPGESVGADVMMKTSIADAEVGGSAYTFDRQFGLNISANGQFVAAEGGVTTPGTFGPYARAEVGLYAAKGEVSIAPTLFGYTIKLTGGASKGSAHIGGGAGIHFNNDGLNIEVFEHVGLGVGEKLGIKIIIPWSTLSR